MLNKIINDFIESSDSSLTRDGWITLESGLTIQWKLISQQSGTTVTFPKPFKVQCFNVVLTRSGSSDVRAYVGSIPSVSGFSYLNSTPGVDVAFYMIAVGV